MSPKPVLKFRVLLRAVISNFLGVFHIMVKHVSFSTRKSRLALCDIICSLENVGCYCVCVCI